MVPPQEFPETLDAAPVLFPVGPGLGFVASGCIAGADPAGPPTTIAGGSEEVETSLAIAPPLVQGSAGTEQLAACLHVSAMLRQL